MCKSGSLFIWALCDAAYYQNAAFVAIFLFPQNQIKVRFMTINTKYYLLIKCRGKQIYLLVSCFSVRCQIRIFFLPAFSLFSDSRHTHTRTHVRTHTHTRARATGVAGQVNPSLEYVTLPSADSWYRKPSPRSTGVTLLSAAEIIQLN